MTVDMREAKTLNLASLLSRGLLYITCFLALLAITGTVLGIVGMFRWWICIPVAVLGAVVAARRIPFSVHEPLPGWVLGIGLAMVVGLSAVSLANPGEHLFTSRDAATYVATAGWLADEGRFLVDVREGPFREVDGLEFGAPGFYDLRDDGRLAPEFFHAFPVLLATAIQLGGMPAALALNPLLGAIALLALWCLAAQFVGWRWALVAVAVLGLNQVFVYFTRAPFSEPVAMLFVLTGLWLLMAAESSGTRPRILAGALLGAAVAVRVDALLLAIPLVGCLALGETYRRWASPVVRGYIWVSAFGLVEVLWIAPWYLAKLDSQFVLIGGAVLAVLVLRLVPRRPQAWASDLWRRNRHRFATAILGVSAALLLFAYFVRPHLWQGTGGSYDLAPIQIAEGLTVDPNRTYSEFSLHWLEWYFGPLGLVLALFGLGVLAWKSMVEDTRPPVVLWLGSTVMVLGAYLWRPSINPDQIWAMRRFLPVVIPALAVAISVALKKVSQPTGSRNWIAIATTVVVLAGASARYLDVWDLHEFEGLASDFASACHDLGPDAAILVLDTDDSTPSRLVVQGFRSYCGFPAASTVHPSIMDIDMLAADWSDEGRQLRVLASQPATLQAQGIGLGGEVFDKVYPLLEYTLLKRPTNVVGVDGTVSFGSVD